MKSLAQRRILLIGGAGFIGHHLALTLSRLGAKVAVVDSLQVNNLLAFAAADDSVPNRALSLHVIQQRLDMLREASVALHVQDARDSHGLAMIFDSVQPEAVIHLAGFAHALRSNADPRGAFEHTLGTLENTLDCCGREVAHLIYFSSSMVYGHFDGGFVTEQSPCNPLGIYGALKYAGEKMVIARSQVAALPYTIVRPSALYGERCVSRRVVQVFLENVLQGRELTVSGDGDDRLDFTYIEDLVGGIVRVLQHENARNETFNLTYGCSRSIIELVEMIEEHFPGISVSYEVKNRLMPDRGTLCIDKARSLIGYDPLHPLERGLSKYVWWYRSLGEAPDLGSGVPRRADRSEKAAAVAL